MSTPPDRSTSDKEPVGALGLGLLVFPLILAVAVTYFVCLFTGYAFVAKDLHLTGLLYYVVIAVILLSEKSDIVKALTTVLSLIGFYLLIFT